MRLMLAIGAAVATTVIGLQLLAILGAAQGRRPRGAAIVVWIDPAGAPEGSDALVARAMHTWTVAAQGRFSLSRGPSRDLAPLRVHFIAGGGLYGEARPRLDERTGDIARADVHINGDVPGDTLNHQLIVYLTALHEIGHALGLPHTDEFGDIMYAFRRPDDGERYFGAYRSRLRSAEDIGADRATGLSASDVRELRDLYDR